MDSAVRPRQLLDIRRPLRLAEFNKLTRDEAIALVRSCLAVDRWSIAVVDGRPYRDAESLVEAAGLGLLA